jgi:stage II sporulation protein D
VGRSIELRAASPARGLGLAERTYSGVLVVEPHGAGGLRVVNRVPLEEYVAGVVAAELVLWSAEPAELEAQAIAARTYAARAILERGGATRGAFLWDDTRDQAYRGRFLEARTSRSREIAAALERAVRATRGRVLVSDGRLVDARFHAACGGATARYEDVFPPVPAAGGASVPCAPCERIAAAEEAAQEENGRVRWEWTAGAGELQRLADSLRIGAHVTRLRPVRTDEHGRWLAVELDGELGRRRMDFDELRRRLGHGRLKSARVVSTWPRPGEPIAGGLHFSGRGRGHGVGLCQVGAHERALEGWSAARILAHYYPGTELRTLPEVLG